jgi:hypothetical protein
VFDEGSLVSLAPGSRGRVAQTTPVGAEVVLEQGKARVHVTHHDRTSWLVDAGPFAVRVTGTDFLVAWAADAETLDVWMHAGSVVVSGPVLGDAQPLSVGQHLRARLRDGTVQIDGAQEPSEASAATTAPAPAPTEQGSPRTASSDAGGNAAPAAASTARAGSNATTNAPAAAWGRLVAEGAFARILVDADAEGMSHSLATRSLGDLRALADAARYLNNASVAKRALTAVRSRFPTSPDARTAAFLLGRVAEEQDQAAEDAAHWYDRYLSEAPGGEFADHALGRKMLIVSKLHGTDAARPIADRYLQRFPSGPYASAARDLAP